MSMLSTKGKYGLRLLMHLAERLGQGPVDLRSIAEAEGIPEKYLSKLAARLVSAGILRSVRGAYGGYELALSPDEIDVLSVVEVLEGRLSLVDCRDSPGTCRSGAGRAASCPRSQGCEARNLWNGLEETMRAYLSARKLSSLAASSGQPEYYI
jgi:Rrf2 family protein